MTKDDIISKVKAYDGSRINFAVVDIDGVLRGKSISKTKFLNLLDQKIGFCNVIFGWDVNDDVYDNSKVTGWHTGFPDSKATIDLFTYRTTPWNNDIPIFLADFHQSGDLAAVCPRTLLKKISKKCSELGYSAKFASEYEWFNFRETPQTLKQKGTSDPEPLTPGMFGYSILRASQYSGYVNDLTENLKRFDVPVEAIHTETGDGVYEASIEYCPVVEAADLSVFFKTGVREIASKHEITASFMAKWNNRLPGCGGHIHQSLWDEEGGKNLFHNGENDKMNPLLEQYVAGQLYCLPYILPMYAPTVNSYKRFVSGSWASTSVSWGFDNRTTALRVITSHTEATRLENRVPGSDANPYLAMAAALASGLYGIENKLTLDIPETRGNEYDKSENKMLPKTLIEAVERMKSSGLAAELFGETFAEHFAYTRQWEWDQFSRQVTDWELKRYFEII